MMKKIAALVLCLVLLLFSISYGEYSSDPNNFEAIKDTIWKFDYAFDENDYIFIGFYNLYYQDSNITEYIDPNSDDYLKLISFGINPSLVEQPGPGMTVYGQYLKGEGTGYVCMLINPSGYTDWFDIYQFSIDGNIAIGTFFHKYGTVLGSSKYIRGVKIKNIEEDQNQSIDIIPPINNPAIDDSDGGLCFISACF